MFKYMSLGVAVMLAFAMVSMSGCRRPPKKGAAGSGLPPGGSATDMGVYGSDLGAGAPAERAVGEKINPGIEFANVLFGYDQATLDPAERAKVDAVAEYLNANGKVGVLVSGHCDERGSSEYNMALGERRALAVRAYIVQLGIDGARVQTVSYGKEQPLDQGHGEEAWSLNRRAQFEFFQQ